MTESINNLPVVISSLGAVAVILYKIITIVKNKTNLKKEKIIENCFGEPMYTNIFSISEAREWIKSRESLLKNGEKATIVKVNHETLRSLGQDLDIGNSVDNYIVIAIINQETNEISDSVLIKYESLDSKLEKVLQKGNGVLVVEV